MSTKPTTHRLMTEWATIPAGAHDILFTPRTAAGFRIASMSAPDCGLRFVALRSDGPSPPSWTARLLAWVRRDSSLRTLYFAEQPEDFDDFLLSLIAPPDDADDCIEAGQTTFEGVTVPVGKSAKLPIVHAGERLCLDVFNPTEKPITVKVTFSGPEAK